MIEGSRLKQRAVHGAFWAGVESWGTNLISFAVFLVLARLLEPDDIGVVTFASVCFSFITIFREQGMGQALIQREELTPQHRAAAFWFSAITSLGFVALVLAGAGWFGRLFEQPSLAPILRGLALAFVLTSLGSLPEAMLRRDFEFRVIATRSVLATSLGGLVGIGMALTGWGVWSLVGQLTTVAAVSSCVLWAAYGFRFPGRTSRRAIVELSSFGGNVVGIETLYFLEGRAPHLLIGPYVGSAALGIYEVAWRLLRALTLSLTVTIRSVAFPTFSRLQHDASQMCSAYYTCLRVNMLVSVPVFIGLMVIAPEAVDLAFGPKWAGCVPLIRILALRGILEAFSAFNGPVLKAVGKPSWVLGLSAMQTVGTVIAFWIALVLGGSVELIVAAWVIRGWVLAPVAIIAVQRAIGIRWRSQLAQCVPSCVAALIMAGGLTAVRGWMTGYLAPHLLVPFDVFTGGVVYALVMAVISPSDLRRLWELRHSFRST